MALIASLLTAVPFTPAGLGLVEGGIVFVLHNIYNVPQTEALAIAVVDRAISVLSIIIVGSIAYVLSNKTKAKREAARAASDTRRRLSEPGSRGPGQRRTPGPATRRP